MRAIQILRTGKAQWVVCLAVVTLLLVDGGDSSAEGKFTGRIPNGTRNISNSRGNGCGHCHVLPDSKSLNAFGSRWKKTEWGPVLAAEDSDGDDVPNGWELGDPEGTWQRGEPDPGNPTLVTSPGQAGSAPPVLSVNPLEIDHVELQGENLWETLTVENTGDNCFGNPSGECSLHFDASSEEAWMALDPIFAELSPAEMQPVDILFASDDLLGDLEGNIEILAADVLGSPQDVLVTLSVPEPEPAWLYAAALGVLSALFGVSHCNAPKTPIRCSGR